MLSYEIYDNKLVFMTPILWLFAVKDGTQSVLLNVL